MSKVSNNSNHIKKVTTTTEKGFLWKLYPIVLKGIGSVVLAGFSLLIKYQSPRVVITVSIEVLKEPPAQVDQVHPEGRSIWIKILGTHQ